MFHIFGFYKFKRLSGLKRLQNTFQHKLLKNHIRGTIIFSKEDFNTTNELVKIIADSSLLASQRFLNCGKNNLPDSKYWNIYPGEHYRLLNALVETLNAKKIVEIGTFTGMGTLALKEGFGDVFVTTYDIIKWDKVYSHFGLPSHLDKMDFNESLIQVIGDLSDYKFFENPIMNIPQHLKKS